MIGALDYRSDVSDYVRAHLVALPGLDVGRLVMRPDFGSVIPEPVEPPREKPPVNDTVAARLTAIQAECDRLRFTAVQLPKATWTKAQILQNAFDNAAYAEDCGAVQGVVWQHAEEGLRLLGQGPAPPVPQPPPVPPPTPPQTGIVSFGGTYGPEHGLAFDLYPGGDHPGALHYGVELRCPTDGTVEKYSIMVGMSGALEVRGVWANGTSLSLEAPPAFLTHYADRLDLLAASPMHIAVFTPDSPATIDGQRVVRTWYGHVQDGFPVGRRLKGARLAICGNSGIASLPGEAAHVHCAASGDGQLSPNGSLPGILAAKWLGFAPRVTFTPGPREYAGGAWFRGKPRGQG